MSSREKYIVSVLLGFSLFPEFNYRRIKLLGQQYSFDYSLAWDAFNISDLKLLNIRQERAEQIIVEKKRICLNAIFEKLQDLKIEIIDIFSKDYPVILKEIYDPPILLYKKGPLSLNQLGVAVVGTRNASSYGLKATTKIVEELQELGCTIISGMALGIDACAHQVALRTKIPTIAVLGTGVDKIYPYQNKKIYQQISEEGALLSEYPLEVSPAAWNFPRRNRIITGLAKAILVMEGGFKSGAMISAKIGLAQDREVYALPGQIFSEVSQGTNWLISQGAIPLLSARQVMVDLLPGKQLNLLNKPANEKKYFLTNDENILYSIIENNNKYNFDDLIEKTTWEYSFLTKTLLSLELKGFIAQLPGKNYIKT